MSANSVEKLSTPCPFEMHPLRKRNPLLGPAAGLFSKFVTLQRIFIKFNFHSFVNVSFKGAALSFALENPQGAEISYEEIVQLISTACKVPAAKCSALSKNFKDVAGQTLTLN
jgi:hypothetical protein